MMNGIGSRKLRRAISGEEWSGGVCAGVAYWIVSPVWIIRLLWFLVACFSFGIGILAYILLWIFLPEWSILPEDFHEITGD